MSKKLYHNITHIHQIMILDGGDVPENLPDMIVSNIESIKSLYPRARYHLWSGDEIRQFIFEHFTREVLEVYDDLVPFAYKADLARYCLLKIYGGMYVDLGIRLMNKWEIPIRKGVAAFKDVPFVTASWTTMQNGLLWSLPNRKEFIDVIDRIVKNHRQKYYGLNPLYPTGPVLLGKVFARVMIENGRKPQADDQHIGSCRCVTPDAEMLNVSYVSKEGRLIALRTKSGGGDLAHIGLYGTNNYNEIWKSKKIYGEKDQIWNANDSNIELEGIASLIDNQIHIKHGEKGRISFGPFIDLDAGSYNLVVNFSEHTSCNNFKIDVCANFSSELIAEKTSAVSERKIELPFHLNQPKKNVEFRTYSFDNLNGSIINIVLQKNDPQCVIIDKLEKTLWEWNFDSNDIKVVNSYKCNDGILINQGTKGRVTYGPYVNIPQGNYVLRCYLSKETKFKKIKIDIGGGPKGNTLMVFTINKTHIKSKNYFDVEFQATERIDNMEFRIFVYKDFVGKILKFDLNKKTEISS